MKVKQLSLLLVGIAAISLVACNNTGSAGTTTPTTSYSTNSIESYKYKLSNGSGEVLAKLVINDANFKAIKTIDNFNCQKDALCGINDSDMVSAAGFEFYNQHGQLISASLLRAGVTNLYADDLHLGAYLMAVAKANNRMDITSLDRDSLDQLQILGRDYRKYVQFNSTTLELDSVKKILIDTKDMRLPLTVNKSGQKSLQGQFAGGNSACLETAKQLTAAGEIGGAMTKFTEAIGGAAGKNPWFEAIGGVFKFAGAFTNGGCDISTMTMEMLKEISAKLDVVLEKQNITLDRIDYLTNLVQEKAVRDQFKIILNNLKKLQQMNDSYINLSYDSQGHQLLLPSGKKVNSLADYAEYLGGADKAIEDAAKNGNKYVGFFKNMNNYQVALYAAIDQQEHDELFKQMNIYCNAQNGGTDLIAVMDQCVQINSYMTTINLQEVTTAAEIFASVNNYLDTLKTTSPETFAKLDVLEGNQAFYESVETVKTPGYVKYIASHYGKSDNWYYTQNSVIKPWVSFVKNITTRAESAGILCTAPQLKWYNGEKSTELEATIQCQAPNGDKLPLQVIKNVSQSFGKYEYVLALGTFSTTNEDIIGVDPYNLYRFVPNLPLGNWRDSCDWQNAEMIGPRDPLFDNNRMILKTKCNNGGDKYSYVDLRIKLQTAQSNSTSLFPKPHSTEPGVAGMSKRSARAYTIENFHGHLDVPVDFQTEQALNLYSIVPSGIYQKTCVVDHVNIFEVTKEMAKYAPEEEGTYAHAIVSCWKDANYQSGGYGVHYAYLKNIYQDEIRYKLHRTNYGYTTDVSCLMNSSYDVQCGGSDLIGAKQIAWTNSAPSYSDIGYGTIFNYNDYALQQEFNSYGIGSHPFYDPIIWTNERSLSYEGYVLNKSEFYAFAPYSNKHQQFWRKVEALYPKND